MQDTEDEVSGRLVLHLQSRQISAFFYHPRGTEPWNEVTDADVEAAYEEITDLWTEKQGRVDDYNEAQLEKNFIWPIFDILGIPFEVEETVMRNARRPNYGFFPSGEAADAAFDGEDFYEEATAVANAKRWGRKLDTRGKEKRDFENPTRIDQRIGRLHRYGQEETVEIQNLSFQRHSGKYHPRAAP